jgi:SAM-dependent methyltransferase
VLGVDRDEALLEFARTEHATLPNLRFESGDAMSLRFRAQFDIVTAARTLQWIADPDVAVSKMKEAAKPAGVLVILDYNHTRNEWQPHLPDEFKLFYDAFLAWRHANRWDNEIGDHLPELVRSAGLADVESRAQDEVVERGAPEFPERTGLWSAVIESIGPQLETAGFCTKLQLHNARDCYDSWVKTVLMKQTLAMRAVIGRAPSALPRPAHQFDRP